jgi:two-component system, NtrC family, response regulator AtoC
MKILIVDDESMQRKLLKGFLEKQGYEVAEAENGEQALEIFRRLPFQLVLLDHRMPDMNGDEVLEKLKAADPFARVFMITAYGDVDKAVRVLKLGAEDFLEKPVDLEELLEKIRTIEQCIMIDEDVNDVARILDCREELPIKMVGNGPAMKEVLSLVRRTASSPFNVLIRGETGTGKELVARLLHLLGPSGEGPFVVVNCGAIPKWKKGGSGKTCFIA